MDDTMKAAVPKGASRETRSSDNLQETGWVAASQRGDTAAFNRLVLKWERPIYNLALRMLQDKDEAADAAQEIFLLTFKGIDRFRGEACFSTWLYRIAANHCTTRLRQRPQGAHYSLDDRDSENAVAQSLPVVESHEKEMFEEETRKRVNLALHQLTPEQRIVVELKFFQDLTFEEIATAIEVPSSTVKTRLYNSLEILKSRLGRTRRKPIGGKNNDHAV